MKNFLESVYFIKAKAFWSTFSFQVRIDASEIGTTKMLSPELPFFPNGSHLFQPVGDLVLSGSWMSLCG